MKRVLFISPSTSVKGGISSVIKGLLNTELTKKHKIFHVTSHVDGPKFIKLVVAVLGLVHASFYLVFKKVDIVHIHGSDIISSSRKVIYFKLVRVLSKCKVIYHFHGADFAEQFPQASIFRQKRIRKFFQESDLVICLSNSWRDSILSIAPDSTVRVLPNAVTIPEVSCQNKEKRDGLQISFLGLIGERKGVFDLLKAIRKLIDNKHNITLNIGGNGDIKRLKKKIAAQKLHSVVRYLGWISQEEKDSLLRETDIYVLPSYGEGMPMSILEAMSYAIPVVSTKVGGIPELITDGETGFLIEPGDLDALYERLKCLIEDKELRKKLGNEARQFVASKHNLKLTAQQIEQIYDSL